MADRTLGLSQVVDVRYGGAARPIMDPQGGLPGCVLSVPFIVHYRFSVEDRTVLNG